MNHPKPIYQDTEKLTKLLEEKMLEEKRVQSVIDESPLFNRCLSLIITARNKKDKINNKEYQKRIACFHECSECLAIVEGYTSNFWRIKIQDMLSN